MGTINKHIETEWRTERESERESKKEMKKSDTTLQK